MFVHCTYRRHTPGDLREAAAPTASPHSLPHGLLQKAPAHQGAFPTAMLRFVPCEHPSLAERGEGHRGGGGSVGSSDGDNGVAVAFRATP